MLYLYSPYKVRLPPGQAIKWFYSKSYTVKLNCSFRLYCILSKNSSRRTAFITQSNTSKAPSPSFPSLHAPSSIPQVYKAVRGAAANPSCSKLLTLFLKPIPGWLLCSLALPPSPSFQILFFFTRVALYSSHCKSSYCVLRFFCLELGSA